MEEDPFFRDDGKSHGDEAAGQDAGDAGKHVIPRCDAPTGSCWNGQEDEQKRQSKNDGQRLLGVQDVSQSYVKVDRPDKRQQRDHRTEKPHREPNGRQTWWLWRGLLAIH